MSRSVGLGSKVSHSLVASGLSRHEHLAAIDPKRYSSAFALEADLMPGFGVRRWVRGRIERRPEGCADQRMAGDVDLRQSCHARKDFDVSSKCEGGRPACGRKSDRPAGVNTTEGPRSRRHKRVRGATGPCGAVVVRVRPRVASGCRDRPTRATRRPPRTRATKTSDVEHSARLEKGSAGASTSVEKAATEHPALRSTTTSDSRLGDDRLLPCSVDESASDKSDAA